MFFIETDILMKNNVLVNFNNFKRTWNVESSLPVNFTIHYSSDIFNPQNLDLMRIIRLQQRGIRELQG